MVFRAETWDVVTNTYIRTIHDERDEGFPPFTLNLFINILAQQINHNQLSKLF